MDWILYNSYSTVEVEVVEVQEVEVQYSWGTGSWGTGSWGTGSWGTGSWGTGSWGHKNCDYVLFPVKNEFLCMVIIAKLFIVHGIC